MGLTLCDVAALSRALIRPTVELTSLEAAAHRCRCCQPTPGLSLSARRSTCSFIAAGARGLDRLKIPDSFQRDAQRLPACCRHCRRRARHNVEAFQQTPGLEVYAARKGEGEKGFCNRGGRGAGCRGAEAGAAVRCRRGEAQFCSALNAVHCASPAALAPAACPPFPSSQMTQCGAGTLGGGRGPHRLHGDC